MNPATEQTKYRAPLLAAALCFTIATQSTHASDGASAGIQDYLSDPHRVGALTGTIIGGALTAHPAGTLAGSLIGFFIGKQTIHKSPEPPLTQTSYARRSFIPTATQENTIPMLALETPTPLTIKPAIPEATLLTAAPSAVVTGKLPQQQAKTAPTVVAALAPTPNINSNLQISEPTVLAAKKASPLEQIASLCYGGGNPNKPNTPDLQALCYYHQSS